MSNLFKETYLEDVKSTSVIFNEGANFEALFDNILADELSKEVNNLARKINKVSESKEFKDAKASKKELVQAVKDWLDDLV